MSYGLTKINIQGEEKGDQTSPSGRIMKLYLLWHFKAGVILLVGQNKFYPDMKKLLLRFEMLSHSLRVTSSACA